LANIYEMSCVLRIEGRDFRVDEFLKVTSLEAFKVWHTGEPLTPKRKDKAHHTTNGCKIDISKADFEEFEIQKSDAIKFLTENFDHLNRLSEFGLSQKEPGQVDFGIYTRMFESGAQFDRFPPELLRLAGSLNFTIELSQYEPSPEE
ncbi:MAG: hypothetical protein WAT61_14090, partial [Flavobacteriales bacterium]